MKKFAKMSLVAAVAVAGLTTTSSAAALSDSIKNTDLSGYLRLRVNTTHGQNGAATASTNDIKAVLNFKSKVNDQITANMKFVANEKDASSKASDLEMNQANVTIATSVATSIVGRQTSATPFTANNGDTVSTGITALIPAGPATIAAAHYNDTTSDGVYDDGITGAGALFSVSGVNLEAWYAKANSTKTELTAFLASTKVGGIAISAHHAELDDGSAGSDTTNTQITVSGKAGVASLFAAYATTGNTSGSATLDSDSDGKLIAGLETITTVQEGVDAIVVGVSLPVGPVKASLTYLDADVIDANAAVTGTSASEYKIAVSYKMAKNFALSAWYDVADLGTGTDTEKSRIEAKYSF